MLVAQFDVSVALQPPYVMDRWRNSTAGAPPVVECIVNYEVHCCKHRNLFYMYVCSSNDGNGKSSMETIAFFRSVSERCSL